MWLSVLATQGGNGNSYTGPLLKTSGPAVRRLRQDGSAIAPLAVGSATVTFTNGNTATLGYTINGQAGSLP